MVLEAMAKDEAIADADAMKKAMKGLDTDEKELVDILAERSLCEIERMKLAYKRRNPEREDLSVWLTKKTDGEFRQLLLALCTFPIGGPGHPRHRDHVHRPHHRPCGRFGRRGLSQWTGALSSPATSTKLSPAPTRTSANWSASS